MTNSPKIFSLDGVVAVGSPDTYFSTFRNFGVMS